MNSRTQSRSDSNSRTSGTRRSALAAALILAASLGFPGCLSEDEDEDEAAPRADSAWVGKGLDTLQGANSAVLMDGKLYVANRAEGALGIAVIDPNADTLLAFHKETLPPNQLAAAGDSVVVATETDYTNGAMSRLSANSGAFDASYKAVNSDNALSAAGDSVFLLERRTGEVTGFTGGTLTEANVFFNVNVGGSSNPHQVALSGKTAFITRYNSTHLIVAEADKKNGGTLDSIDLSDFVADSLEGVAGAVPRMDGAAVYGDRLFVTVQRLGAPGNAPGAAYAAVSTSKVVVIDIETREVVGEIPLQRRNPVANAVRGKYLFVVCVDQYGSADGAVERIDMETAESAGLIVEEKDLEPASDLVDFLPTADDAGYVLYAPDWETKYIKAVAQP